MEEQQQPAILRLRSGAAGGAGGGIPAHDIRRPHRFPWDLLGSRGGQRRTRTVDTNGRVISFSLAAALCDRVSNSWGTHPGEGRITYRTCCIRSAPPAHLESGFPRRNPGTCTWAAWLPRLRVPTSSRKVDTRLSQPCEPPHSPGSTNVPRGRWEVGEGQDGRLQLYDIGERTKTATRGQPTPIRTAP